jgi:hypothetical protein
MMLTASSAMALLVATMPAPLAGAAGKKAAEGEKKAAPSVAAEADANQLSMEIAALQTLRHLEITPRQLAIFTKNAQLKIASQRPRKAAKTTVKFRKVLVDLRDAIVKNQDKRVTDLSAKMDKMFDEENVELDDRVYVTEFARKRAPEVLKQLNARQVAAYLAVLDDDIPDPVNLILHTLDKNVKASAADWKEVRDDVADEIGWLVAGFDIDKANKVVGQVSALMDKMQKKTGEDAKTRQTEVERLVHKMMGDIGPLDVLRHVMEHDLAELLSNPQLPAALEHLQAGKK